MAEDSKSRKPSAPNGNGSAEQKEMPPASQTPAPSIGPHTEIEKEAPEERLSRHEQSDVDAMGLDKRRPVIGGSYSPSLARQATIYGIFLAVLAALVFVAILAVDELDKPPEKYQDEAPWVNSHREPAPIDFPEYGEAVPSPQP
jgi:hypothetical protein